MGFLCASCKAVSLLVGNKTTKLSVNCALHCHRNVHVLFWLFGKFRNVFIVGCNPWFSLLILKNTYYISKINITFDL